MPMHPFKIYDDSMLDKFKQFMYKEDEFKVTKDYDIAVLLGSNRKSKNSLLGMFQLCIK